MKVKCQYCPRKVERFYLKRLVTCPLCRKKLIKEAQPRYRRTVLKNKARYRAQNPNETWLKRRGDRTFEDIEKDEKGMYVFMGTPQGDERVYIEA